MKVGRRLAIKLLNASKFVLAKPEPQRAPSPHAVDRGLLTTLARHRARLDRGSRGVQLRARARAHGDVLLVVLRQLPGAGQGAPLRRSGRRARGVRERRAADRALGDAAAVRAVSAVRDRGSVVVVAGRLDPHGARGRRPRKCSSRAAGSKTTRGRRGAAVRRRRARRNPQEEIGGAAAAEDAVTRAVVRAPDASLALLPDVESDLRASRPDSASSRPRPPTTLQVEVELAAPDAARAGARVMKTVPFEPLDPALYRETVRRALAEDLGWGDVTTEATVDAGAPRARRDPRQVRLRDRRPRRGRRGVPPARSGGGLHRQRSLTAIGAAAATSSPNVRGAAGADADRRADGAEFPAAAVRHRDADAAVRRRRRRRRSPSSTRARRRRRCARSRSTPSAPAAAPTIAPGWTTGS